MAPTRASRLLDDGGLVGARCRGSRAPAARVRAFAERLELRRELGDARFERDALLDLRGERVLERREPCAADAPGIGAEREAAVTVRRSSPPRPTGGDALGCSQNASTSPTTKPSEHEQQCFQHASHQSPNRLSTGANR